MISHTNIFQNIPTDLTEEIFEKILSTSSFTLERIISKGHTSPKSGWYDQKCNEWVMILQGEAVLSFQNSEDIRLGAGDYVNIAAHTKHKVSWTKPGVETIWLTLHY